jgi:hypothetical protein
MVWHLGNGRWLIVEIDSQEFHGAERQVRRDATRQNGLLGEGQNIILRFFPSHLSGGHFVGEVAQVLDRERWQPARQLPPRPSRRRRATARIDHAATAGSSRDSAAIAWSACDPDHMRFGNTL